MGTLLVSGSADQVAQLWRVNVKPSDPADLRHRREHPHPSKVGEIRITCTALSPALLVIHQPLMGAVSAVVKQITAAFRTLAGDDLV